MKEAMEERVETMEIEVTQEQLAWIIIIILIIEGVWLSGLTYLMYRRKRRRKEEEE